MAFLNLFEGYGIELEYMIVDDKTLKVLPITDQVFKDIKGKIVSDIDDGALEWSNELVMHVVELKVARPVPELKGLSDEFARGVKRLNEYLKKYSAKLLPTAMHPFMDTDTETKLWPHDNNEVYASYNRIFDCRGHGWSNVQSTHINLPFKSNDEFVKLHAAIRVILPLVPALAASSPIYEGKVHETQDARLEFYKRNQIKVPIIAGDIIPEQITSMQDYHDVILSNIYKEIAVHDHEDILKEDWLNSRGAIARFERQSIEIRLMDIQESPLADCAIIEFIVHILKQLCIGNWISFESQHAQSNQMLKSMLDLNIQSAENTILRDKSFAKFWGCEDASTSKELLKFLFEKTNFQAAATDMRIVRHIELILGEGTLATRMKTALKTQDINSLYQKLAHCLAENESFKP